MKNRTDEYWALVNELSQPPEALEGSVDRARKRAKRSGLVHRLAAPAASLAAMAATFVLLVNVFPAFALACSGVPIIRELTAAVAFSPSLSAAVAHEYVQYIGQSRTVDGVTVNLEYAIVDQVQMIFFYSVDGKDARFYTSPSLKSPEGETIGGYGTSTSDFYGQDGLETMSLYFTDGNTPPTNFTLEMYFMPAPKQDQASEPAAPPESSSDSYDPDDWGDPREDPGVLHFAFDLSLEPGCAPTTVEVGRWLELDGQRIQVDRLVYSPTRTAIYLKEDEANTAWLRSIKFWFEDETGRRYDNIDGSVSASGEEGSKSYLIYYFQSFYYDPPKGLTLRIDKAEWLDKDAPHVFLDLTTGEASNLPDGVSVGEITRTGKSATVKFFSPPEHQGFGQLFGHTYWDPEGGEHYFNQWSSGTEFDGEGRETGSYEQIYFENYPWDKAELELSRTSVSVYKEPISVPLF